MSSPLAVEGIRQLSVSEHKVDAVQQGCVLVRGEHVGKSPFQDP